MKLPVLALVALLLLPPAAPAQAQTTAFVNVAVLPMDRERILEDHTVLVRNGLIEEVAPSYRVEVPEGTRIIDGEGLFLMPGLADMQLHLPGPRAPAQEVEDFLFLCLANDVMVVRGVDGSPNHLQIKGQTASGALLGPIIYAGSPPLDGENAQDGESAINRMLDNRRVGYDFQTLRQGIRGEVWDSLAEEAHSRGYSFGGIIPDLVGLRRALSTGISTVESLDGYLEEIASDAVQARLKRGEDVPLGELLESVEGRKMRAIAAHTRSSDSWVVPTLFLWEARYRQLDVDSILALPEMSYVSEWMKEGWILSRGAEDRVAAETAELWIETRRKLLRALVMAGVGVLMGTDAPELFCVPGFCLRHELRSMEAAGLTPYEVLVTGTRDVAEYAGGELLEARNFGTVEAGNRADLILLRANPLESLDALWDQEGVMVRGRWIPREEIESRLADMAERNGR